jgi:hypothetical protein
MFAAGSTAIAELVAHASLSTTWSTVTPLTPVGYYPKSGLLPAVIGVRDRPVTWDTPGQTRTLLLSDDGSVVETITDARPLGFFAYNLTDFQKLFGRLVDHARAEWTFTQDVGGTHIHWSYAFFAKRGAGLVVAAIVHLLWAPYMRRVLPGIVAEVERRSTAAGTHTNPDA